MSKVYESCHDITLNIVKAGFLKEISLRELQKIIRLKRGGDPRTIRNWIRNLTSLEFLLSKNSSVFEINFSKYPELLPMALKGSSQKKLL